MQSLSWSRHPFSQLIRADTRFRAKPQGARLPIKNQLQSCCKDASGANKYHHNAIACLDGEDREGKETPRIMRNTS